MSGSKRKWNKIKTTITNNNPPLFSPPCSLPAVSLCLEIPLPKLTPRIAWDRPGMLSAWWDRGRCCRVPGGRLEFTESVQHWQSTMRFCQRQKFSQILRAGVRLPNCHTICTTKHIFFWCAAVTAGVHFGQTPSAAMVPGPGWYSADPTGGSRSHHYWENSQQLLRKFSIKWEWESLSTILIENGSQLENDSQLESWHGNCIYSI